jgi:hypothetical protein
MDKYVSSEKDDFEQVIRSVNALIRGKGYYRKFRSCEGTDGWAYGLLTNDDWNALESGAKELVALLFTPV